MKIFYSIVFFIYGAIFGSFYNVVGYRVPNKMSLIKPASHCPKCNHKLNWLDLFPIFSYLFSRGKCRYCKEKIPMFYLTFELITGILFMVCYLVFGLSYELIIALTFVSVLICITISDINEMIIPDSVLFLSYIIILLEKLIFDSDSVLTSILSSVVLFSFLYLIKFTADAIFKKESLGGGDVKLMFVIGLVIDYKLGILLLFLAAVMALPISIINLYKTKNHELPFGPYLAMSAIILYFLQINLNDIILILL